jgi:hypothetical protein
MMPEPLLSILARSAAHVERMRDSAMAAIRRGIKASSRSRKALGKPWRIALRQRAIVTLAAITSECRLATFLLSMTKNKRGHNEAENRRHRIREANFVAGSSPLHRSRPRITNGFLSSTAALTLSRK